jgi:hypothetical protein
MIIKLIIKYCDNCNIKFTDSYENVKDLEKDSAMAGWTNRAVPNSSVWDLCPECSKKATSELR